MYAEYIMRKILNKILSWFRPDKKDPVHYCTVYKNYGCSHIDGLYCDMDTCSILDEYKIHEMEQQLDIPIKMRLGYERKD
jgi:hypothetical protein